MFRSRFGDAFPKSLPHFGPQELERDVVETSPGDRAEHLLCALLGLALNRKQDVKIGHYGRALEDAITSHKTQWPSSWNDKNPLSGGATFNSMTPSERLTLLRTLILWSMASSDTVKGLINQSYRQNRQEDDVNQARSVQPWGSDGDKRRYFLIEGQDDTNFRIYRESNPAGTNRTWISVAGSIGELKALAEKLRTRDGGPKAKKLAQRMLLAIPRFEAGEEKRKRREYRQMRKEQFKRPEPGFSMYEGRTRGKRIKYTYSDDEDVAHSDATGQRRSARNTGSNTPADDTVPITTSSGRQIRAPPRLNMVVVESVPASAQRESFEMEYDTSMGAPGRPRRSATHPDTNGWPNDGSRRSESEEESEADFGDDENDVDAHIPSGESGDEDDLDEETARTGGGLEHQIHSLVVKLSVTPPKLRTALAPIHQEFNLLPAPDARDWNVNTGNQDTRTVEMHDAPDLETSVRVKSVNREQTPERKVDITPPAHGQSRQAAAAKGNTIQAQTPSVIPSTSLALRGSPEKTLVHLASPSDETNGKHSCVARR